MINIIVIHSNNNLLIILIIMVSLCCPFWISYCNGEAITSPYNLSRLDMITLNALPGLPKTLKPNFKLYCWSINIPIIWSILSASVVLDSNVSSKLRNIYSFFYLFTWDVGSYISVWYFYTGISLSFLCFLLFLLVYSFDHYSTFYINILGGPFAFYIHFRFRLFLFFTVFDNFHIW